VQTVASESETTGVDAASKSFYSADVAGKTTTRRDVVSDVAESRLRQQASDLEHEEEERRRVELEAAEQKKRFELDRAKVEMERKKQEEAKRRSIEEKKRLEAEEAERARAEEDRNRKVAELEAKVEMERKRQEAEEKHEASAAEQKKKDIRSSTQKQSSPSRSAGQQHSVLNYYHRTPSYCVDEDMKSSNLSLNEVIAVAQNRPLWRRCLRLVLCTPSGACQI